MNVKEITKLTRAGYCYYYVQTSEVTKGCEDILAILGEYKNGSTFSLETWDFETNPDPGKVIELLRQAPARTAIVAKNFNWFLKDEFQGFNKEFVQHLQNNVDTYSSSDFRKILIIISDNEFSSAIPECLQKDFMNLEYSLPDVEEIKSIFDFICLSVKESKAFVKPSKEEEVKILDSAKGLTRREVQNAFAYSLIKDEGKMKSETIAILQAKEVEKTAGLKIGKYNVPELLGYDNLKKFVLATITSKLAKGIMLLGPAGTGKTHFCKWIASAVNMKIIEMEMAELFGSLVGESEKLMKKAIDIITANAPCILFIDKKLSI